MSCPIYPAMQSIKQGAVGVSLELDFGVILADLTDPVLIMRRRTEDRSTAVVGLGTLTQPTDEDPDDPPELLPATVDDPLSYAYALTDPQVPGVYLLELDADEGTWPMDAPMLFRIVPDVGDAP